jgi:3-hydroxybutyryl-CoA dehydrogenase
MTFAPIKKVAIAGAGTMGRGIAQACAVAGFDVVLYDVNHDLAIKSLTQITSDIIALQKKSKLTPEACSAALTKITVASQVEQLQADLFVEAVVEKLKVKQDLLSAVSEVNAKDCILVTNTSSLSVTEIASGLKSSDNFAGLHFFNPAPVMKLVEIVRHENTRPDIIERLQNFVEALNKISVVVMDSPGFIVNRVARQFYLEALRIAEEGTSDLKTIDELMRSVGFKMGPFELMDLIGMDVNAAVTESLYNAFKLSPRFKPSNLQMEKVKAGHLGRKSGKGFYEYP